jgi:hypothetical protein
VTWQQIDIPHRDTGLSVTTVDHEAGDWETVDCPTYVLVTNDAAGYHLTHTQVHANATTVLTIKRETPASPGGATS